MVWSGWMEKLWHLFCIVPPCRYSDSAVSAEGSYKDLDREYCWVWYRGLVACLSVCACLCLIFGFHVTSDSHPCHPRLEPRTEAFASLGPISLLWQSTESSSVAAVFPIHYTATITILFDTTPLACVCICVCEHLRLSTLEPQSNLCFPFHRMPRMGGRDWVCVRVC